MKHRSHHLRSKVFELELVQEFSLSGGYSQLELLGFSLLVLDLRLFPACRGNKFVVL